MNIVPVGTAPGRELRLVLEADVRAVSLRDLPPDGEVLFAVDSGTMPGDEAVFRFGVRFVLGPRAHVLFFERDEGHRMCADLAAIGGFVRDLLERETSVVLCASYPGSVELLAAAVLLCCGRSQAATVAAIREALPDAFPDVDSEVTVAVIEEYVARNSL